MAMRAGRPVTVAMAAVFALSGCADEAADSGPATPPPAAATSAAPTKIVPTKVGANAFVSVVRARVPEVAAGRTDQEIQAIADTACADLTGGKDSDTIVDAARTLGTVDAEATDHATARELVKLAIDTTCLDQAPRVDEF
jgi:hypothetical protein